MLSTPRRQEIDHRTLKLIVGVVAISLPVLTSLFASDALKSISESYYENGWPRTIFIGFLFAIASFLLAHNGVTKNAMILSKIASAAGFGVALFPCDCGHDPDVVPLVHGLSAAVMFIVLTYVLGHRLSNSFTTLTFWGEALALWAFRSRGLATLGDASRVGCRHDLHQGLLDLRITTTPRAQAEGPCRPRR